LTFAHFRIYSKQLNRSKLASARAVVQGHNPDEGTAETEPVESRTAELIPRRGFRIEAAALYLGVPCWTIQEGIYSGRLTARRIGRFTIILKEDLDRFAEACPVIPSSPNFRKNRKVRLQVAA
jgi:excisionase family DNA binding protein